MAKLDCRCLGVVGQAFQPVVSLERLTYIFAVHIANAFIPRVEEQEAVCGDQAKAGREVVAHNGKCDRQSVAGSSGRPSVGGYWKNSYRPGASTLLGSSAVFSFLYNAPVSSRAGGSCPMDCRPSR